MLQPVWVVTHTGTISYLNQAAVTAVGFDGASELIGQNGHWLVHYKRPDGSHFPVEDCPLTQVRQTGEPLYLTEDWWVRKDGSMIPVSCTAAPIPTAEGYGTAVAFTDITERLAVEQAAREHQVAEARAAELAASETRQHAILEAALDGVISIDRRALVTYANTAAERMFGYRAAGIHPAILTQRGLAAALTALTGRLPVPVELDLPERRLTGPVEASVYFFCSEALTNVVKHARASSAWVRVTAGGDLCAVEVRDDGIGGAWPRSDTSGLTGLHDRIGALNGAMDIISPPEGGTVLRASIPLSRDGAGP